MALRDATADGRVLFWTDSTSEWGNYLTIKRTERDSLAWLHQNVGYALIPTAHLGHAPYVNLNGYGLFAVTSDKANGNRGRQKEACALLARMSTPQINDRHVARSGNASVMTQQVLPEARFGHEVGGMITHAWNEIGLGDVNDDNHWQTFIEIIHAFATESETGTLTDEQLAD